MNEKEFEMLNKESPLYYHKGVMRYYGVVTKMLPIQIKEHVITFNQKSRFAIKPELLASLIQYSQLVGDEIAGWCKENDILAKAKLSSKNVSEALANWKWEEVGLTPDEAFPKMVDKLYKDAKQVTKKQGRGKLNSRLEKAFREIYKFNEYNSLAMKVIEKSGVTEASHRRKFSVLWGLINIEW